MAIKIQMLGRESGKRPIRPVHVLYSVLMSYLVLIGCLIASPAVLAGPWFVEPSIYVGFGFNSNPELVDSDTVPASEASISDAVDGERRDEPNEQAFAQTGVNLRLVSETEIKRISADLAISAGQYEDEIYDTNATSLDLAYVSTGLRTDSEYGVLFSEEQSIDEELDLSGISIANLTRSTWAVDATYTSRLSEVWTNELMLGHSNNSFDGGGGVAIDYEETTLSSTLIWIIDERLSYSFGGRLLAYRPDPPATSISELETDSALAEDQNSLILSLGLDYALTQRLSVAISLDPTYVETPDSSTAENTQDSLDYSLGFTYNGLNNDFGAEFSSTREVTSLGGLSETSRSVVSWSRRISERFNTLISWDYAERAPVAGISGSELSTLTLGGTYQLRRNFGVDLEYRYRRRQEDGPANSDADSNQILITFNYSFARFKAFGN